MADPISALSLAACFVQFVDCGFRFISTSIKIYQSATWDLAEQDELSKVISALQSKSGVISGLLTPSDPAMAKILESCMTVSSELQAELSSMTKSLKFKSGKGLTSNVANSAITAVRTMVKSNRIRDLEARFVRLREQLVFHLTATLYEHRLSTESALSELIGAEKTFHQSTISWLERIIDTLEDLKRSSSVLPPPNPEEDGEHVYLPTQDVESFGDFAKMFAAWTQERRTLRMEAIIRSLEFPQITDRETSILEAHKSTFNWAFSQDRTNLADWMSNGSGIYWVSGKAGSGKSTLLKFLTGHKMTERLLQEWSGSKKLVTASHYFWAQGTKLQKSHQGLLQTLVCQILTKYPEQVAVITPTRWSAKTDIQRPWSLPELSDCVKSLAMTDKYRICLFVDGLDEYQGDHQDLVDALEALTSSDDIKICASSRPWVEFTSTFGSGHWKLQVQDLTSDDIFNYSRDQLKSNRDIGLYGDQVDRLAKEISSRAQGVFLWVYLVVRSLIRGMRHKDTMADLWERLNELPTDLEEYFRRMLDSIEPIYRKRTARALRALSHIKLSTTTPVITFYFLDLEMEDPNYALRPLRPLTSETDGGFYVRREEEKQHQLVAQCRDLVHVSPNAQFQNSEPPWSTAASFLHRTVADFLKTSEVHDLLVSRSGDDFDPLVSLSRSYLAQVKIMEFIRGPHDKSWGGFRNDHFLPAICSNVYDIEMTQGRTEGQILDSIRPYLLSESNQLERMICGPPINFLNLAIRLGLSIYVKELLRYSEPLRKYALMAALMKPIRIDCDTGFNMGKLDHEFNLDIANHILDLGTSPNEPTVTNSTCDEAQSTQTIWSWFLSQLLFSGLDSKYVNSMGFRALRLMLSYGANPSPTEWEDLKTTFGNKYGDLRLARGGTATEGARGGDENAATGEKAVQKVVQNTNETKLGAQDEQKETRHAAEGPNGGNPQLEEQKGTEDSEPEYSITSQTQHTTASLYQQTDQVSFIMVSCILLP